VKAMRAARSSRWAEGSYWQPLRRHCAGGAQAIQDAPFVPHWSFVSPAAHKPVESQHPVQLDGPQGLAGVQPSSAEALHTSPAGQATHS
jgi:hypothetical protein